MYERFTASARKVMQLANQEAHRYNHEYIGTEHILLGLIKEGSGVAANALKSLGVDLRTIRREVEKRVQSGPDMVTMGKLPQTPGAKKVIEYSMEEARNLNLPYLGTEHILLGLLRENEGVAAQVLMYLGLKLEEVRKEVLDLLGTVSECDREALNQPTHRSQYERFTDRARKVMQLANQESQRFNHEFVGTEHILLGLIKEGSGVAASVLRGLGIDLDKIRMEVEQILQRAPVAHVTGTLPQTLLARNVIKCAMEESRNMNYKYVGTEHILLGLLREHDGIAAQVLMNLGLKLDDVRAELVKRLEQEDAKIKTYLAGDVVQSENEHSAPASLTDQEIDKVKAYLADKARQSDKEYPALPGSMYDRFTDRARGVIQLANQQAKLFNQEYIGTEHILLGLVSEGSGVAANVLKNLNIDLDKIRLEVGKLVQRGRDCVAAAKLPLTPRAKKVAEYAMEEARNLNHNYIGTEHLLLGVLREEEGVAAQVLMNFGLNLGKVRKEVLNLLGQSNDGGDGEEPS